MGEGWEAIGPGMITPLYLQEGSMKCPSHWSRLRYSKWAEASSPVLLFLTTSISFLPGPSLPGFSLPLPSWPFPF